MVDYGSRELVAAALDGYGSTVAPAYELARQEFHESLVGNCASLADVTAEIDVRRANSKLLASLVGVLPQFLWFEPRSKYDFTQRNLNAFIATDPAQARGIQATTIYHPAYHTDKTHDNDSTWMNHRSLFGAHVIVGSRSGSTEKTTDVLLHSVESNCSKGLSGATVKTKHLTALLDIQARRHVQDFDREQMADIIKNGRLQLDRNTPGALRTTHPLRIKEKVKMNDTAKLSTDLKKARLGATGIERFGLQFTPLVLDRHGLANHELAEYNVFEHLIELASRFERTDAMKAVLVPPKPKHWRK